VLGNLALLCLLVLVHIKRLTIVPALRGVDESVQTDHELDSSPGKFLVANEIGCRLVLQGGAWGQHKDEVEVSSHLLHERLVAESPRKV